MNLAIATEPADGELVDGYGIRWAFKVRPCQPADWRAACAEAGVEPRSEQAFTLGAAALARRLLARLEAEREGEKVSVNGTPVREPAAWPALLGAHEGLATAIAAKAIEVGGIVTEQRGNS